MVPTRVLRLSKSGHIERNTHPFRIEGVRAAARKQEVGIPEKIRVGRSNVGAEEGARTLEGYVRLSALASRPVEGILTFVDRLQSLRGFCRLGSVPIL